MIAAFSNFSCQIIIIIDPSNSVENNPFLFVFFHLVPGKHFG